MASPPVMASRPAELAAPPASPAHRGSPPGHVVPVWVYLIVYLALIALTALTAGVSFLDLGPLNNVVAVGIAVTKALLVMLVFMHVRWSPRLVPLAAVAGFFWLILLIAGVLADYLTRGLLGVPGK